MTDDTDALMAQLLKTVIENTEQEIKERGFVVGARVKCKYVSHMGGKGHVTSVSEGEITVDWKLDNGNPVRGVANKARLLNGTYYVQVDTQGIQEVRLWGVM